MILARPPLSSPEARLSRGESDVEAQRFTRRLALSHYENFIVGGLLTPRRVRQDFYNIYAYCRMADDLADEIGDRCESLARLDQWGQWLVDCYDGATPPHPVFTALRPTIERFAIPREPFLSLLEAFRQDQRIDRYERFDQVLEYCRHSANPVGHLVLHLGECFSAERAALADHICTGLQLANFCQDVRRDAQMGRIYVPGEDLARHDVDPSRLAAAEPPPGGREVLRDQVERAEAYFARGLPLVRDVPRWLGREVRLFVAGGSAILDEIRQSGFDVWTRRPRIGPMTRVKLLWRALGY